MWFDHGELEILKDDWMSEFLDEGDKAKGAEYNEVTDINCPRCDKKIDSINDSKQRHIIYEVCTDHGIFMDAGEFTDYKYDTLMDVFRDMIYRVKSR